MENTNITVTNLQHKSNAPWILGIIAFCMSIPNILCATVCAAVANEAIKQNQIENGIVPNSEQSDDRVAGMLVAVILVSIFAFILSFFGKSKISVVTGILLILIALFILVNGWVGLGSFFWGTITGILYLISGVFSIVNKKRIA